VFHEHNKGVPGSSNPIKSSLTIKTQTPAGPRFFYAPAYTTPYLDQSISFEQKLELISQTIGIPLGILSKGKSNTSTPWTVSFSQ